MNIPLKGGYTRTPKDAVRYAENVALGVATGWNREHKPDGTHATTWQPVTFESGQFSADGAMTWTVASNNINTSRWFVQGTTMHWTVWLINTTIGGTVSSFLYYTIPGGYRGAGGTSSGSASVYRGGSSSGIWVVENGSRLVRFSPDPALNNWSAGTLYLAAEMIFEVTK